VIERFRTTGPAGNRASTRFCASISKTRGRRSRCPFRGHGQTPAERGRRPFALFETDNVVPVEDTGNLFRGPAEPFDQLYLVQPGFAYRAVKFEFDGSEHREPDRRSMVIVSRGGILYWLVQVFTLRDQLEPSNQLRLGLASELFD